MVGVKQFKEAYLGRGQISYIKVAGQADVGERSRNPSRNVSNKMWIKYIYTILVNYNFFLIFFRYPI
jgi:hypothetical protein